MYRKIIVPVDMGQLERGESILKKAVALLSEGGKILLLNVAEDLPSYLTIELPADFVTQAVDDARAHLASMAKAAGVEVEVGVRVGSPAREILAAADEWQADLVIIASHRPNLGNYLLGATADRVVRHSKCSVLVDR